MQTTIDAAGRVVIPKALRDQLGLVGGETLDIVVRDRRIEIEVPATPVRLVRERGQWGAIPERQLPALTTELVRETIEQLRR